MKIRFFKCLAVPIIIVLLVICTNNVFLALDSNVLKVKIQNF